MELIIATRNCGKCEEIQAVFPGGGIRCIDLNMLDTDLPRIDEDAASFAGNAVKKAVITSIATRRWCLADDSGIEVDALEGAPGIHSARYAGEPCNDAANNSKLLEELRDCEIRAAQFKCVLALSSPSGRAQIVEGECRGRLAREPRGNAGFGYDPLFIPDGYNHTMAELGVAVKNRISHRAMALCAAFEQWGRILVRQPPDWPARDKGT